MLIAWVWKKLNLSKLNSEKLQWDISSDDLPISNFSYTPKYPIELFGGGASFSINHLFQNEIYLDNTFLYNFGNILYHYV